jgi:hypothetical protein
VPDVIAIDIDLGRLHAYSTSRGRVAYNAPEIDIEVLNAHDVVLAECWSPQMYMDLQKKGAKAELTNRLRACIFNSMTIGKIAEQLALLGKTLLVSPSSKWTMKYPEKIRHIMANCDGKDNHDIRECRAMLAFYKLRPSNWVPYETYLKEI